MAQHLAGQTMPKLMRALCGCDDTGTSKGMLHDRTYCTSIYKAADGSLGAQKYTTAGAAWSPVSQIGRDCLPDIRR